MNERCFIGSLRQCLHCCLDSIGGQDGKDGILHEVLSQIQRSLNSTPVFKRSGGKLEIEVQNCVISKNARNFCLEDLEGLASDLISVLAYENSFTIHSVGKTFMALFGYLHDFVSLCAHVTDLLWIAVKGCFGCDGEFKVLKNADNFPCPVSKHEYSTIGFSLGMHLLQILHGIMNKFKQEGMPHLDGFVTCSAPHIYEPIMALGKHFKCFINNSIESRLEVKDDLILAVSLRFLCSFTHSVTVCGSAINPHIIFSENRIVVSLVSFLEAISDYCLDPKQTGSLSRYLCHKLLMLMFRLQNLFAEWPLLASTCSEILRANSSTLCPSMFVKASPASPLFRSPFVGCLAPTKKQLFLSLSAPQSEKYAVYLIFKVEFSLMKDPSVNTTGKGNASSFKEQQAKWISNWLSSKMALSKFPATSHFAELSNRLASSFLQIFIDEDTLLLEILLLLQDYFISDFCFGSSDNSPSKIDAKSPFEIFRPVRLFAVFLSLISYDHLVILDFLIERSSSILCLQYFLRSMRFVRNTWPELLSLSNNTSSSPFMETGDTFACEASGHHEVLDIDKVCSCLIKLRDSIARLHEKQAFPYNPSALLKHLDSVEFLVLGESS